MGSKRRQRLLTPEERALWAHVTRHDLPLQTQPQTEESVLPPMNDQVQSERKPEVIPETANSAKPATFMVRHMRAKTTPPQADFDVRLARRLARGQKAIEAKLDLHGLRQQDAYVALRHFLVRAQHARYRQVLVITGKGSRSLGDENDGWDGSRGVLRRLVPLWLNEPDFRLLAVSYKEAAVHHGGSGALYILIRRPR